MKKRLLIDMDDVMADTFAQIVKYVNERRGTNWQKEEVNTVEMMAKFHLDYQPVRNFLWEKGFFSDIPLMADAQEVVEKLHQKYELFVVSAATEFPLSMTEKLDWLAKHFPYIGWEHTVFCGHKFMIKADYLIDDHEKNLTNFTGTPLLFTAPHNLAVEGFLRMNSWKDISNYLL
jgi:5'-nucleotidase